MEELEGHVAAMALGADVEGINPNGKIWVPMTPQLLRTLKMLRDTRSSCLMFFMMFLRQMAMYMVQLK